MKIAKSFTELVGNTPIVELSNLNKNNGVNIFAKCEFFNPMGSIKDRIALAMVDDALKSGAINKDTTLIEPTSGNTGVGLAWVCASLGIKLIIVMPDSMSIERRALITAFGAKLELTPASGGMKGAIAKAEELQKEIKNATILQQFKNPSNPAIHKSTTAKEILESFGDKSIDIFVAGVGTGGSLSGVGEVLRAKNPNIKIYAVEPNLSPVLSGGAPGPHKIQGIGAGFVPDTLNTKIYDKVVQIDVEDAFKYGRELAQSEGILAGISSGANIAAAVKLSKEHPGKVVLTILNDTGERYLSTDLFKI